MNVTVLWGNRTLVQIGKPKPTKVSLRKKPAAKPGMRINMLLFWPWMFGSVMSMLTGNWGYAMLCLIFACSSYIIFDKPRRS